MMQSRRYGRGPLLRGSAWPQQRWNPSLDGQKFHVTRGKRVRAMPGQKRQFTTVEDPAFLKVVSCKEVDCPQYQKGWVTRIPLGPDQPQDDLAMNRYRYNYIRDKSDRSFLESWDGSTAVFVFGAEQTCFNQHRRPLGRDPKFGLIRGPYEHRQMDYDEFFDAFNETSYQLGRRKDRHG